MSNEEQVEYAARLAFKRNLHQTFEENHRRVREVYDGEINRIGVKIGVQEAENKENQRQQTATVREQVFIELKFEDAKSERLAGLQAAHKNSNLPDKWNHAFNVLRQANAVIGSRYYGTGYGYSYWLYGEDRIFRQPLKEAVTKTSAGTSSLSIFPEELAALLTWEESGEWIVIKGRQFLGSESFAKIAAITKDHGGDYISAGKESHFRLPKKKQ